MTTLGIDYAWKHPDPAAIYKAGYRFVLRYLSTDPTKNLSVDEAAGLHGAGLSIGLVWETTATRATAGYDAGKADRLAAERQAAALRYPADRVIFWACDEQADPASVLPYAKGWWDAAHGRQTGPYGDDAIIENVYLHGYSNAQWQTEAWSGTTVSPVAWVYQRVKPTLPAIPGSYDEDVLLNSALALWAPAPKSTPKWPGWSWFSKWFWAWRGK